MKTTLIAIKEYYFHLVLLLLTIVGFSKYGGEVIQGNAAFKPILISELILCIYLMYTTIKSFKEDSDAIRVNTDSEISHISLRLYITVAISSILNALESSYLFFVGNISSVLQVVISILLAIYIVNEAIKLYKKSKLVKIAN